MTDAEDAINSARRVLELRAVDLPFLDDSIHALCDALCDARKELASAKRDTWMRAADAFSQWHDSHVMVPSLLVRDVRALFAACAAREP